MVKTLHQEKARKREHGKGLTTTDTKLMAQAENLLYEEFAFALGIGREAVVPFIQDHLPKGDGFAEPTLDRAVNG